MSLSELKILLDKFYDGTTSLKEENLLREFFTSDRVPSDMIADKEIFLSLSRSADNIVVPDNLKSSISDMIDQCEARDNEKNEPKGLKVYFRNHIHTLRNYSIAASVVILFGLALNIFKTDKPAPRETFTDPQEAYMEAEKILALVSDNLRTGIAGVELTEKNIGKVKRVLEVKKIIE